MKSKTKTNKIILLIIIVMLILTTMGAITYLNIQSNNSNLSAYLKIGVLLPLSGPAAIWGKSMQDGIEIARTELQNQNLEIIYEDTKANPAESVTAYNKLKMQKPDIIISAISRSTIPIIPLAEADKIPLIATITTPNNITVNRGYLFRFFVTADQVVDSTFKSIKPNQKKLAVLYSNDEFGRVCLKQIRANTKKANKKLIFQEAFDVGTTDFKTQLAIIKSKKVDAIIVVDSVPNEIVSLTKQIKQLNINTDLFESSILLSTAPIRQMANITNNNTYTNALPFTLKQSGNQFRNSYKIKYNKDPLFPAAFGYDSIKLITTAKTKYPNQNLKDSITNLNSFYSTNGQLKIQANREINPILKPINI